MEKQIRRLDISTSGCVKSSSVKGKAVEMGTAVEAIMEITHKMAQRNGLPIPEEISGKIENIRTEMAKAREATKQCPVIISKLSKILELQE